MNKVVAGNWKMHHGPAETRAFLRAMSPAPEGVDLLLFPPAISLPTAAAELGEEGVLGLGVQNVHPEPNGAFTGEISAEMAADGGARFGLVGHSERRHLFGEDDALVARKVAAVRRAGLTPVLCVGETLAERKADRLEEILVRQLEAGLGGTGVLEAIRAGAPLLVAYEPVWAIGTGENATPADAAAAHGLLRTRLAGLVGEEAARAIPILYGGSVAPANAFDLLSAPGVDGVLVGGSSLDPERFCDIASEAARAS